MSTVTTLIMSAVYFAMCNCCAFAVGIRARGGRPFTSVEEEIAIRDL